ncbi:MAG: hypothetical protein HC906_05275 [Bacteroidales bacterium]|nr:hypothetical protein [Bacteroidales bacterium]
MPELPGLSDAGNCRDWETDIPIDLEKIRDKDEEYWNKFKGLPKAFISLDQGQTLWENRFGNLTSLSIDSEMLSKEQITENIKKSISVFSLGFEVKDVKKSGLYAARNGVDFSELFLV